MLCFIEVECGGLFKYVIRVCEVVEVKNDIIIIKVLGNGGGIDFLLLKNYVFFIIVISVYMYVLFWMIISLYFIRFLGLCVGIWFLK